jgi:Sugar (and other) transporter
MGFGSFSHHHQSQRYRTYILRLFRRRHYLHDARSFGFSEYVSHSTSRMTWPGVVLTWWITSKWGYYLLWCGLCVVSFFIVYFFIPETARLPMEEIGALFGDEVVVRLTADGHSILEDKLENLHASVHLENLHHDANHEQDGGTNDKFVSTRVEKMNV